MDQEFTKWIITLGVGGVLAAGMFMFYRKDMKQYTELWAKAADQLMIIIRENTESNARLITMLETQERNAIRKSDIEAILVQHRLQINGKL